MSQQALTNQTINGDGVIIRHNGGRIEAEVSGVFNGATVTLRRQRIGGATWVPVQGGVWTSAEFRTLERTQPCDLQLTVSGAAAGTSLNAWV